MRDYITGVTVLFVITMVLWAAIHFLDGRYQLSILEMWGLVNLFIVLKTGIDIRSGKNFGQNELQE